MNLGPLRSFIYKRMILRAILNNIIIRKKNKKKIKNFKLLLIKHHINIVSLNYKIIKSCFKNMILL